MDFEQSGRVSFVEKCQYKMNISVRLVPGYTWGTYNTWYRIIHVTLEITLEIPGRMDVSSLTLVISPTGECKTKTTSKASMERSRRDLSVTTIVVGCAPLTYPLIVDRIGSEILPLRGLVIPWHLYVRAYVRIYGSQALPNNDFAAAYVLIVSIQENWYVSSTR